MRTSHSCRKPNQPEVKVQRRQRANVNPPPPLSLNSQVNMIKDDGTVIHFNNPKVQASLSANTFAITGHAENKQLTEMLPGILSQLGADSLTSLRKLAEQFPRQGGC